MKTIKIASLLTLLTFIGCLFFLHGCKKAEPPVVAFSFQGGGCTAPCAVLFSNETKDGITYYWDFADGTHSEEKDPAAHTYNQGGTYNVTLTSSNEHGTSSASHEVFVQNSTQSQLPTASFTISNNGCTEPCAIGFNNTSTNAVSYSWNFGEGSPSTATSPSHTYSNNGNYTVTLTATNPAGSNQSQQIVTIGNNPCGGVTCLNGGTCVGGICSCPPGYTGANCGTELTPTTVTITKIKLNSYPTTNGGSGWDLDGGPDIFLSIDQGTNANDVAFSGVANDQTGSSITYTTNFPTTLSFPSTNYSIGLWDYDQTSSDDFMGGINFIPNNFHSGFPSTIHLSAGGIDMTLYVTWNF